jgi:hypothetical protein
MRLPEFTAEASLGKIRVHYVLMSGRAAEAGRVLPQVIECDPGGYCICRGGEGSGDCQDLKVICGDGNWLGCDELGRCYCSVPDIYRLVRPGGNSERL